MMENPTDRIQSRCFDATRSASSNPSFHLTMSAVDLDVWGDTNLASYEATRQAIWSELR